jgi:7-cyano-7-deazaguanine synthase
MEQKRDIHSGRQAAVVLLSGGLDSAVTLAMAREAGFMCYALTIDYGQRHRVELAHAREVARLGHVAEHKTLALDLRAFGGSSLTGFEPVPPGRLTRPEAAIPSTYVPGRNTIFLSLALAWAEVLAAQVIFIGANYLDYSGYPDCRPEYLEAFQRLARLATKAGVARGWQLEVRAPLLRMTKAEIILQAQRLGVDLALTHSCYNPAPDGRPCGACDSCLIRAEGFRQAGIKDPAQGLGVAHPLSRQPEGSSEDYEK